MKALDKCRVYHCILLMCVAVLLPDTLSAQRNFVYTNDDQAPNTVSAFSVAADGTLTAVPGSPFFTGGDGSAGGFFASNRIGAAVVDNFLFASNSQSGDVSVFTIDPGNGKLTLVPGSPFSTRALSSPFIGIAVAPTPDGRFLIAANGFETTITVFSIGSDGALTPIPGSPFPTLSNPDAIKITPDGRFLAVSELFITVPLTAVEMFSIAPDGSLTSLVAVQGGEPDGLDIDCSGSLLYVGETAFSPILDVYNISASGTLAAVPGSPFQPNVVSNFNDVLLSPDDKTLFATDPFGATITVLNIASDSSISPSPDSPLPMNGSVTFPAGMATSQDGRFLYVADFDPAVSVFTVRNGTLTEVAGSPFFTGTGTGLLSLAAFPPKTCVSTVAIAVNPPAIAPVSINPESKGKIPVAILSTPSFSAVTQVDSKSLTFGHNGNEGSLDFCNSTGEDVNGDGLVDLVCHFNAQQTGFFSGDSAANLKGKTITGKPIQGSETIRTVPQ